MSKPTIIFAGGGHAHLYSLRRTRQLTEQGFDIVLVNPSRFLYYSGMAPGLLSRIYRPEQDRIDVKYLVEKGGGRFVKDRVKEIRSRERTVMLEGGCSVRYDAMSVCLGSGVPKRDIDMSEDRLTPVKPVENMEKLHWELRGLKESGREPRVLIIGGGAAGCEMACNGFRVFEEHGIDGQMVLADANDALLKLASRRARREIEGFLRSRGGEIMLDSEIVKIEEGVAHTRDGREIGFDVCILSVGIQPPDIFQRSGLATDEDNGLFVNHYLRSISDDRIFGGGDAIAFRGEALPKLGVFAIRQAPVIFHNLQAVLKGEPLKKYRPRSSFLYVLNLGNREGLAVYGPLVWRGALAWRLKRYIDVKFMKQFQYPEDETGEVRAYFDRLPAKEAEDFGVGIGSLDERTKGITEIPGGGSADGYARPALLAGTDWLEKNLDEPNLRIIDCRDGPGDYYESHVPRAVHMDYKDTEDAARVHVLSPGEAARVFGELGIGDGNEVVIYDDAGGSYAGRIWWTLFYYGHEKARILNGGWKKWVAEKRPYTREIPKPKLAAFTPRPRESVRATAGEVLKKIDDPNTMIFDTRGAVEYFGILEKLGYKKRARRGGHIPSARRVNWTRSLLGGARTMKPASELDKMFKEESFDPHKETITYCQSGARSGHELFALRLLGYDNVKNYDGSWKEWGNGDYPVEIAPNRIAGGAARTLLALGISVAGVCIASGVGRRLIQHARRGKA
jgi:3-mercaptopyruvate sulfurtransferase SseA/NADH dehydrogenase FAD-containing subunit